MGSDAEVGQFFGVEDFDTSFWDIFNGNLETS